MLISVAILINRSPKISQMLCSDSVIIFIITNVMPSNANDTREIVIMRDLVAFEVFGEVLFIFITLPSQVNAF